MSKRSVLWNVDLPENLPEWTAAPPAPEWICTPGIANARMAINGDVSSKSLISFSEGLVDGVRYAICRNCMGIVCSYIDVGWHPVIRQRFLLPENFSEIVPYDYCSPHGGWTYFGYGLPFERGGGGLVAGCDYAHFDDMHRTERGFELWSVVEYEDVLADVRRCVSGLRAKTGV